MPSKSFDAVVNFTALSRVRVGRHLVVWLGGGNRVLYGKVRALAPTVVCCLKSWAQGVVRVPGKGREKLTARTNKKKKLMQRTLHTLQHIKLSISITYRYLNRLMTIYALILIIRSNCT